MAGANAGQGNKTRRAVRWLLRLVLWPLLTAAALLASTAYHANSEGGRRAIVVIAEALVSELLVGDLEIGELESLTLRRVAIRDARLLGADGQPLASFSELSVEFDPVALTRGEIHVPQVRLSEPWADLRADPSGAGLALVAAVMLADDSPTAPASSTPPPLVRVDEIIIDDLAVAGLPEELSVRDGRIVGSFTLDGEVEVEVSEMSANVLRAARELATVESLSGRFDMHPDTRSSVTAALSAGEDWITLDGHVDWTSGGPGPGAAAVDFALSPALLDRLGVPEGASMVDSGLRGTISIEGTIDQAVATADLATDGGAVHLSAERTASEMSVEVSTDGLSLGAILPALGETEVGGSARARMDPNLAAGTDITLDVQNVRYDEWVLPAARARAAVSEDRISIAEVSVPHYADELEVTGYVTFDGDADLAVRARIPSVSGDANVARLVPGIGGAVAVNANVRVDGGDASIIDVEGRVRADGFRAPGLRVGHFEARGSARGDLAHPVVNVRVDARAVEAGAITVEEASLDLRGGPERYAATGVILLGHDQRLDLDATVIARGARYLADGNLTVRGLWPEPVRVVLSRAVLDPERFISAERLSAESTGLAFEASGRYAFAGRSELEATIGTIDLHRLGQALGRPMPTGSAEGGLTFAGTLRAPELTARGNAEGLALGPLELPELSFVAALSSATRQVSASVHADAAGYGRIDGEVSGQLAEARGLEARILGGTYQGDVNLAELPATLLSLLSPELPPFDGSADVSVTASGTAAAPVIGLQLTLTDFAAEDIAPMQATVRASYRDAEVVATVGVDDALGVLATAQGTLAVDLPAVLEGASFDVEAARATLDLSVPLRRLDRLPAPLTVDLPFRASLEAHVERDGGVTSGSAGGRLVRLTEAVTEGGCETGPLATFAYEVTLAGGRTTVDVRGDSGGTSLGTAHAEAATPVDAWIADGMPEQPPSIAASGQVDRVDLSRVPVACERVAGLATLRFDAEGLLTSTPRIDVEGGVEALAFEGGDPAELRFAGGVDDGAANVDAMVHYDGRSILELTANAGVTFGADGRSPALAEGPSRIDLRLDRAPAQVLFGPLSLLAQSSGTLDGQVAVAVHGATGDFTATGEIGLDEVAFIVTDPVVRVEGLNGTIAVSERGIELRDFRLRDRAGTATVEGLVTMEGLRPSGVEATIVTNRWNLRADGIIFASVNTELSIEAELGEEAREIRATFDNLTIEMPEEMGHSVQDLTQHPDVIYEDQPEFYLDSDATVADDVAPPAWEGVPMRVIVDATDPFWIRRDDFSVQLTADLRIDADAAGARITGPVKVKRGFLNLLGRAFDLQQGEIAFSGGGRVDPTLNLRAIHVLQSRESVTVTISGHLSDPRISFSTTVAGAETEAEIIELLVSGHGGSSMDARDQMVSVIGAMTASFISSMTRRSLGAYMPVMSIEAGSGGSTRIRAGVTADALIPDFLDGIVESAYVEGFVGSSQQQTDSGGNTTSTGAQGGFLIELYWPRQIVTAGSFEQPANWAFDVTWEP